jgi:hypothetical protein
MLACSMMCSKYQRNFVSADFKGYVLASNAGDKPQAGLVGRRSNHSEGGSNQTSTTGAVTTGAGTTTGVPGGNTGPVQRPVYEYTVRVCKAFAEQIWSRCDKEEVVVEDSDGFDECVTGRDVAPGGAKEYLEDVLSIDNSQYYVKFVYVDDENAVDEGTCFNSAPMLLGRGSSVAAFLAAFVGAVLLF